MYEDDYCENTYYAKVCGIKCSDLNRYEIELAELLNFELTIDQACYQSYVTKIQKAILATQKGEANTLAKAFGHLEEKGAISAIMR